MCHINQVAHRMNAHSITCTPDGALLTDCGAQVKAKRVLLLHIRTFCEMVSKVNGDSRWVKITICKARRF